MKHGSKPAFCATCAIIALVAVSGCSTPQQGVRVEYQEVLVTTPIYCATADQIPAEPPQVGDQLTGDAAQDVGILAISALELRKSFREAVALLSGCVEP